MSQQLSREEQEHKYPEYTWGSTTILKDDETFEATFKEVENELGKEEQFKGHIGDSVETLYSTLGLEDTLDTKLERVYVYAHLKQDQDTASDKYIGMKSRAHQLVTKLSSAWSFLASEILQIDEDRIQSSVNSYDKLQGFASDLKLINEKRPYALDVETEELLTEAQDALSVPSNVYGMFDNADLVFEDVIDKDGNVRPLTQDTFIRYSETDDRKLRESVFENVHKAYGAHNNMLDATLAGEVEKSVFDARTHNYKAVREKALSNNHIPENIYDNLVKTIHKCLPLLHRYTELRKELLGLGDLKTYDLYTPLIKSIRSKVLYGETEKWMLKALEPMDGEYLNVIKEGLNNRWADVYENRGRRSGGYSSGACLTNPSILLDWSNTVSDLYTLVHGFGHLAHSYFSRRFQPSGSSDHAIFVTEVASICSEVLLSDYMDEHLDDEKRLLLLNQELEHFRTTLLRQTMSVELEHKIRVIGEAGEPLMPTRMSEEYAKLNKLYLGDPVETDEDISKEWLYVPHFCMNYYVYQCTTGYSTAQGLGHQILTEGKPVVDRHINEFLKKGSSNYPIGILENTGVGITTPGPVEQACEVFEQKLNTLEKLMKAQYHRIRLHYEQIMVI